MLHHSELNLLFLNACKEGDLERIKLCLTKGANINAISNIDHTSDINNNGELYNGLQHYLYHNYKTFNIEIFEYLLKAGINPNYQCSESGNSYLHLLVSYYAMLHQQNNFDLPLVRYFIKIITIAHQYKTNFILNDSNGHNPFFTFFDNPLGLFPSLRKNKISSLDVDFLLRSEITTHAMINIIRLDEEHLYTFLRDCEFSPASFVILEKMGVDPYQAISKNRLAMDTLINYLNNGMTGFGVRARYKSILLHLMQHDLLPPNSIFMTKEDLNKDESIFDNGRKNLAEELTIENEEEYQILTSYLKRNAAKVLPDDSDAHVKMDFYLKLFSKHRYNHLFKHVFVTLPLIDQFMSSNNQFFKNMAIDKVDKQFQALYEKKWLECSKITSSHDEQIFIEDTLKKEEKKIKIEIHKEYLTWIKAKLNLSEKKNFTPHEAENIKKLKESEEGKTRYDEIKQKIEDAHKKKAAISYQQLMSSQIQDKEKYIQSQKEHDKGIIKNAYDNETRHIFDENTSFDMLLLYSGFAKSNKLKIEDFNFHTFEEKQDLLLTYLKHKLPLDAYYEYTQLKPQNSDEKIPPICIKGRDLEDNILEIDNYTLKKLDKEDPRGAILGCFTGCCQSISEIGSDVAKYGIESHDSGFYVLLNKEGDIVAQCWAWRYQNMLFFDTVEAHVNYHAEPKRSLVRTFFEECARQLIGKNGITSVVVGCGTGLYEEKLDQEPHVDVRKIYERKYEMKSGKFPFPYDSKYNFLLAEAKNTKNETLTQNKKNRLSLFPFNFNFARDYFTSARPLSYSISQNEKSDELISSPKEEKSIKFHSLPKPNVKDNTDKKNHPSQLFNDPKKQSLQNVTHKTSDHFFPSIKKNVSVMGSKLVKSVTKKFK